MIKIFLLFTVAASLIIVAALSSNKTLTPEQRAAQEQIIQAALTATVD